MCSYLSSISLIRYLLVWRVNGSLVRLPRCLSAELSSVLGAIITKRLPTNETRRWRKALVPSGDTASPSFPNPWPIDAILFAYPGKRTYGQGEFVLWELKLIGESADHGLFLELILPAMEEASYTSEPQWNRPNKLWGRFDIHSVYVARGPHWEPLVSDGRLDLRYRASPVQWAEGLTFGSELTGLKFSKPTRLIWLASFDLSKESDGKDNTEGKVRAKRAPSIQVPALRHILEALMDRMRVLRPDLRNVPDNAWHIVPVEEQPSIQDAMEQADNVPIVHKDIKRVPKDWPGRWTGTQIFSYIPPPIIPYLELASILHIGRHTHFGCGTFALIRSTSDLV